METNNNQFAAGNQVPLPAQIPIVPGPIVPPREYSKKERVLVFVALGVAVLYDRLGFAPIWENNDSAPFFSAIFWLIFLVIYYAVYWKKLEKNKSLWLVGGLTAALCIWNIFFDYNGDYGRLTYFVIPLVLMAHTQFLAGGHTLKNIGAVAIDWILGWFFRPFSAIKRLFGATSSMVVGGKKSVVGKVLVGIVITLPLLGVIIALLSGADMVFQFYMEQMFDSFEFEDFIGHLFIVAIAFMLFYSFLWNIGYANKKDVVTEQKVVQIDLIITCIVLGAVAFVYVLFCTVQFTYLFAGAGLPGKMTYSEYAREGFAQIIVICGLNLAIFGVFLQYGNKHRAVTILLAVLQGVTAVILVSGIVRLKLYIDIYGLTWLRLLSAWFMFFLAAVIVLCCVRMVKDRMPLLGICAFVLLGWYVLLGYANPDALIVHYNLTAHENAATWLEENRWYVSRLSDNGKLQLLNEGLEDEIILPLIVKKNYQSGYSVSSYRLRKQLDQLIEKKPGYLGIEFINRLE